MGKDKIRYMDDDSLGGDILMGIGAFVVGAIFFAMVCGVIQMVADVFLGSTGLI